MQKASFGGQYTKEYLHILPIVLLYVCFKGQAIPSMVSGYILELSIILTKLLFALLYHTQHPFNSWYLVRGHHRWIYEMLKCCYFFQHCCAILMVKWQNLSDGYSPQEIQCVLHFGLFYGKSAWFVSIYPLELAISANLLSLICPCHGQGVKKCLSFNCYTLGSGPSHWGCQCQCIYELYSEGPDGIIWLSCISGYVGQCFLFSLQVLVAGQVLLSPVELWLQLRNWVVHHCMVTVEQGKWFWHASNDYRLWLHHHFRNIWYFHHCHGYWWALMSEKNFMALCDEFTQSLESEFIVLDYHPSWDIFWVFEHLPRHSGSKALFSWYSSWLSKSTSPNLMNWCQKVFVIDVLVQFQRLQWIMLLWLLLLPIQLLMLLLCNCILYN